MKSGTRPHRSPNRFVLGGDLGPRFRPPNSPPDGVAEQSAKIEDLPSRKREGICAAKRGARDRSWRGAGQCQCGRRVRAIHAAWPPRHCGNAVMQETAETRPCRTRSRIAKSTSSASPKSSAQMIILTSRADSGFRNRAVDTFHESDRGGCVIQLPYLAVAVSIPGCGAGLVLMCATASPAEFPLELLKCTVRVSGSHQPDRSP